MSTKICKHCGWEYPITHQGRVCLICGEPFEKPFKKPARTHCAYCGVEYSEENKMSLRQRMCMSCYKEHHNKATAACRARLYSTLQERFDAWLAKVRQVPRSYPTLTEAQWLEACSFFNGCARCNSEVVDTRGFFIGKSLGGRYCDWNVIPLCERCAKIWQLDRNMFIYAMHKDNKHTRAGVQADPREYRDNLEKIVEYLEVRLDAAIGTSADTKESTDVT